MTGDPVQGVKPEPDGTTSTYFGQRELSSPEDKGAERHGHAVANEQGDLLRHRNVGEKGITR